MRATEYRRIAGPVVRRVSSAVKSGRLIRPTVCSECAKQGRIQGHHHNGYGPEHELDVVWLCVKCHKARHPHVPQPSQPIRDETGLLYLSARRFRQTFNRLTEPAAVYSKGRVIGHWYPFEWVR